MTGERHDAAAAVLADTICIHGDHAGTAWGKVLVDKRVLIGKRDGREVDMRCASLDRLVRRSNKRVSISEKH